MDSAQFPLPTAQPSQWVVYLTARCNFACDYCIQKGRIIPGQRRKPWGKYEELTGEQWVRAFNDLPVRPDHTLILTGGEPSIHKDFYYIASHLEGYKVDLTSNLTLDVDRLTREMNATGRKLYSSFHTFHPDFITAEDFVEKAIQIRDSGVIENPLFSMVNLDEFPHFRSDQYNERFMEFCEVADRRGLQFQRNEFRGNHMGAAFAHEETHNIECTSGWVNMAPNGDIYNCQYHLEARKNCFGNITDIENVKPMPEFGSFFSCSDFGYCDPCHENSGRGAFRDANGVVFRRTDHDPDQYLKWMEPSAIAEVGRRYLDQGQLEKAQGALRMGIEKLEARGEEASAETWSDLGISLWAADAKQDALDALLRGVQAGDTDSKTIAAALELGRETEQTDDVRNVLIPFVPADRLAQIEDALTESF